MKLPPMSNEERRVLVSPLNWLLFGFIFIVYTLPTVYVAVLMALGKVPVSWLLLCWGGGATICAFVLLRWHRLARKENP